MWGVAVACYAISLFHRASFGVAATEALHRYATGPAVLSLFAALQLGVYLALQVPSGLLADRLGPRRVITTAMVTLAVGCGLFAISTGLIGGISGRVLIGLGDAFMFTNVLRLAAHWFPAQRFGRVAALTGLAGGAGQLLSTMPLSSALHDFGWEAAFSAAAAVTALLGLVAVTVLRDRPPRPAAEAHHETEAIGRVLRSVVSQRGTQHSFWLHFVLMSQFVAVTTLWGSPWLIQAQGVSQATAGALLLCCVLAFLSGAWLAGQFIAGRLYRRESAAMWLSWAVAAAWAVIVCWPGVLPLPVLGAVLVIIGLGGGSSMLAFDGARAANAAHRAGAATGVVNMGGFSAAVLIQIAVGGVLQLAGAVPALDAYRWAFVPVLVLVVAGTVAQIGRRARR